MTRKRPASRRDPEPTRRTSRVKRRPAAATLAPAWREWIAENALRGVAPDALVATLRANGVPSREARARVADVVTSPLLPLARRRERHARRLEMLAALARSAARTALHPTAIERRATIPREEFFDRYYANNVPVVLTGLVSSWPASARWTPAYLKDRFGHVEVQMTTGREGDPDYDINRARHFAPTTLGAFVDRVLAAGESNDFYLIARNHNLAREELQPLFDDVDFAHGYFDRARVRTGSALWFGPAGTVTPLHHDTSNILFAQVYGRKKLCLVAPNETALWRGARAMYADWDPECPEAEFARRPELRDVLLREVALEPGEALFIPAGWWHHVRALTVSISLAVNAFAQPNAFGWFVPGAV
jgi:hypothetical protein